MTGDEPIYVAGALAVLSVIYVAVIGAMEKTAGEIRAMDLEPTPAEDDEDHRNWVIAKYGGAE